MDVVQTIKNVGSVCFAEGKGLNTLLDMLESKSFQSPIILVDKSVRNILSLTEFREYLIYEIDTAFEPEVSVINDLVMRVKSELPNIDCVIGIGGGSTLDTAKSVSNLITNPGKAEDFQGWDLLTCPGVFKVAVPTLFGTGAEASRTCVLTNKTKGIKLGMNSDFSLFDHCILDGTLSMSCPDNQFFYTAMDTYIHCMESLEGNRRHPLADAYSREALAAVRAYFDKGGSLKKLESLGLLTLGSYLGGCAIAASYVGLIHPLSAAFSVIFGWRHCVSNCIAMRASQDKYPEYYDEFWGLVNRYEIEVPHLPEDLLTQTVINDLYNSFIVHEKPLSNAFGAEYRDILSMDYFKNLLLCCSDS